MTVYLCARHVAALEGFKLARGFPNMSAALRGLLEVVMETGADHVAVRKCGSCEWGTTDPSVVWCPECEGKIGLTA